MLVKLIVLACIFALAACQTPSDCTSTSFDFYNGFNNASTTYTEQLWDWRGSRLSDGTSDTFDGYLYLSLTIGDNVYYVSDFYQNPVDYVCMNGTTDKDSASFASYTYNVTETIQLHREFYAPRATSWLRVVDTIRNYGAEEVTVSLTYEGDYGSDDGTRFHVLNDYYWVSSDGGNGSGDPPFSVNAATAGAQIAATRIEDYFVEGDGQTAWTYYNVSVPAGESRSVMLVLGQYATLSDALEGGQNVNNMPVEIFTELTVPLESIVNWDMCAVQFVVANPAVVYCESPVFIKFNVNGNASFTFNGTPITPSNNQFTTSVNGVSQIHYQRFATNSNCLARNTSVEFSLPATNFSIAIDNSGTLPSVSATGGYGSYNYTWMFSTGGDLNNVFGGKATVTVSDKEGCTASAEIDVPTMQQLEGVPVAPSGNVSGASESIVMSLVALVGFVIAV